MSIRQIKRGSTASVAAYIPAAGEFVLDTTTKQLRIGNGVTPGGTVVGAPLSTLGVQVVAAGTEGTVRSLISAAKAGANTDITSLSGLSTALSVAQGGTGATSAAGARASLGAAASGSNSDITALSGLTTALSVAQGGTGATTSGTARTNLGAAASGANSDITSLSALSTALSVAQGGTGVTSLSALLTALKAISPAWTSYTPTLTAQSGTYTTSSSSGRYVVLFGICHFSVTLTITTKGTGVTPRFTLPVPAGTGGHPILARESAVNGKSGMAVIEGSLTSALVYAYDSSDLVTTNGCTININGSYPIV